MEKIIRKTQKENQNKKQTSPQLKIPSFHVIFYFLFICSQNNFS
jgi:hypothetical protein